MSKDNNKTIFRSGAVSAAALLASTVCWGGPVVDLSNVGASASALRTLAAPLVSQSQSQGPFAEGNESNPPKVFGKTYGEWAAEWTKWTEATNFAPINDKTGVSCGVNQPRSGVWFLAGTFGIPNVTRRCSIPANRYLFYPLNETFWIDCKGTPDEDLTDAEVRAVMADLLNTAAELTSTVDGVAVAGLQMLTVRAQSPNFSSILPQNTVLDSCSPGGERTGRQIVDGYWVMLPPLSRGQHKLTLHGSGIVDNSGLERIFENGVTYFLTIGSREQ